MTTACITSPTTWNADGLVSCAGAPATAPQEAQKRASGAMALPQLWQFIVSSPRTSCRVRDGSIGAVARDATGGRADAIGSRQGVREAAHDVPEGVGEEGADVLLLARRRREV